MKTVTFYSYKGGVGRSLALVNIASRLIEFGKSVCLLDFDLEAPGLNLKFGHADKNINKGIVDYIYDFSNKGILNKELLSYTIPVHIPMNIIHTKPSYIIPAGNTDSKDYWRKLSAINWYEMIYERKNGLAFFLDLKEKVENQLKPDFFLIDSRTGISEISGISLSLMADEVVVLAANNKENLEGVSRIIRGIRNSQNELLETIPKITFVLSRIPFTDRPEDKARELMLINNIKDSYLKGIIEEVNIIHSDRELEEGEKIKIGYDKNDLSIPQVSRDYLLLFEKLTKECLTVEEVQKFNNIKKVDEIKIRLNSFDLNEYQKLDLLNKAIELVPDDLGLITYRIHLCEEIEKFDLAIKDAMFIRSKHPDIPASYLYMGDIYNLMKKYREAIDEFNIVISLEPLNIFANLGLGLSYYRLGLYDDSINYYTKLLNAGHKFALIYNGIATALRLKKEFELALGFVYKALELEPKSFISIATLAEIKAAQGIHEEFFLHFERAIIAAIEVPRGKLLLEKSVFVEDIYKQFKQVKRFRMLLEKYGFDYGFDDLSQNSA